VACLNPDGTPTASGRAILAALRTASRPEELARTAGVQLYRVRSSLRELAAAGFVSEEGGRYVLTAKDQVSTD
jgi:DNA-binding IclR family transcriptional regulator